ASPVNNRDAVNSAESNLNEATKLDPQFQQAAVLLAELKIRKGSPGTAIELLLPFTKLRPALAQAHYLLAAAYLGQQQFDAAVATYREMAELFPKDPQPPFQIGTILVGQRRPLEARKEFEKSADISSDFLPATEMLVNLDIADRQYTTAIDR